MAVREEELQALMQELAAEEALEVEYPKGHQWKEAT